MGILDSLARAFGGLRPLSDDELSEQREVLRQRFVSTQSMGESTRLYDELRRYDAEGIRRANEAYERENPDAPTRHREHGWYLPNDD